MLGLWLVWSCVSATVAPSEASSTPVSRGEALFTRSWTVEEGLGPKYNADSCGACHEQAGGAGGLEHNTLLVGGALRHAHDLRPEEVQRAELELKQTGLAGLLAEISARSERNTPALWGAGLIDQIPDEVLLAQRDAEPDPRFPEVTGRLVLGEDGRPGRLGWKGDIASLAGFVAQACSNELGLATPDADAPELSAAEVADMAAYVASLPAPPAVEQPTAEGKALLTELGCASCHVPDLGEVRGLYSDLMLHDMGPGLSSIAASGSYGGAVQPLAASGEGDGPASAQEWRTPPLWGLAATGPYLHDGRADTLVRAIAMHGGEAEASQRAWATATVEQRAALMAFLTSLGPPSIVQQGTALAAAD